MHELNKVLGIGLKTAKRLVNQPDPVHFAQLQHALESGAPLNIPFMTKDVKKMHACPVRKQLLSALKAHRQSVA